MTISRAFFLAVLVAGSAFGQAAANPVRNLTTEAVNFKLPAGWEWQSEIASNIAVKKDIKIKDQSYPITAELVYNSNGFLEDSISDIEKKVAASKGDLKDLKVVRGEKFAGTNATMVTYARVRGEKQSEWEDERQYLFRRNNALYIWTERNSRAIQSQASSAFGAARSALSFVGKDLSRVPKTFTEEGIKYNLPPDWEYDTPQKSDKPNTVSPIMIVETAVTVKGVGWRVGAAMFAYKDTRTLDDMEKGAKENMTKQFEEVKDFKIEDKQTFNGEKAILVTFTGKPIRENDNPAERPRLKRREYVMKRKGYIILWMETTPEETNPAVEATLKKARDGLTWL
jgi:hypothetical protein